MSASLRYRRDRHTGDKLSFFNEPSHQCPAEGCLRQIVCTSAFCCYHWKKLPSGLQDQISIWRECGNDPEWLADPNPEYKQLMWEAVQALKMRPRKQFTNPKYKSGKYWTPL